METVRSGSRPRPPLPDGPVLVVGLARSGVAAAVALTARGVEVSGVDSGRPEALQQLDAAGVPFFVGVDGTAHLEGVRTVVKSPGVPQDAPVVGEARARGIEVIGELELGWRMIDSPFLAITGTNGKSTTTELAAHIFRSADRPVVAAGNLGRPLASLADDPGTREATVVCEASSFQLEDSVEFAPECATFLNLSPDHLDRYPDFDSYGEAKLRIFRNQDDGDVAVVNTGDPWLSAREIPGNARKVGFSPNGPGSGGDLWIEDGEIVVEGRPLIGLGELRMLGRHNVANAMAAAAGALAFGLDEKAVAEGLAGFEGVAHRLEPVGEVDGVLWVNDSKATNVNACMTALAAFEGPVRLILGGRSKGEEYGPLGAGVAGACVAVYLIGENAEEVAAALEGAEAGGVAMIRCGDLERAVEAARADARPGESVLLSPASASFDQFEDFEERGNRFRSLVGELDGR